MLSGLRTFERATSATHRVEKTLFCTHIPTPQNPLSLYSQSAYQRLYASHRTRGLVSLLQPL